MSSPVEFPALVKTSIRPLRYQPLALVLAALCGGIVADRYLALPLAAWGTIGAAAWLSWLVLWRAGWSRGASLGLLAATAGLGGAWHHDCWSIVDLDEIGRFARQRTEPAYVEGIVVGSPRPMPLPPANAMRTIPPRPMSRVVLDVTGLRDEATVIPCSGRMHVTVVGERPPDVQAGDHVGLFGNLSAPRPVHNPGEFDFASHARGERLLARMFVDDQRAITLLSESTASRPITRWLDRVRAAGALQLAAHIAPERSALATAILLGAREHLEPDLVAAYVETGTVHVLSISGLHLGILAGCLLVGLRTGWLPRRTTFAVVSAIVTAYAVLTYAEPPIVRSAVLVVMICLAGIVSRQAFSFNTLAAGGLIVLALNPADLFRIGTQLSFLAMATMNWLRLPTFFSFPRDVLSQLAAQAQPWPLRFARRLGRWAFELTRLSFDVWLLSIPIVVAQFHAFNPIAILLNAVLWLPTAVAMLAGFCTLTLGWIASPVGAFFGTLCDGSLWMLDESVHLARTWRWGWCWLPGPDAWWLAGCYGLIVAYALLPAWRPPRRFAGTILAAWCALGLGVAWQRAQPSGKLECTFLSVGHGCSVLTTLPDGRTLLYDAGTMSGPDLGARVISSHLWHRGLLRLDALVISHDDSDHYNAVPQLVTRFAIGTVYVSPGMLAQPSPAAKQLFAALAEEGCKVETLAAGDVLRPSGDDHGVTIEVWHPPATGVPGNDNANSIVLSLEFAGRKILLTGDLERAGMEQLVATPPAPHDLVLAPHHGSANSSPAEFAAWCRPRWAIISGDAHADPQRLAAAYAPQATQLLETATHGAIQATITPHGDCTITTTLHPRPTD